MGRVLVMANYRTYAQEGNFSSNLQKNTDESDKILNRAEKQRSARVSVEQARRETAEIYNRAQELAGITEAQFSEANFKLDQSGKKAQIEAVQSNYKIELDNNEARAADKARDMKELQAWSKSALDFTNAVLKKGADDRKKAASVAAYTHGFDMETLKGINELDSGLTYSQFQQTDLFRQYQKEGKPDAFLQAMYEKVYLHRGAKRWVDNVAIIQNHAASYQNRVTTFLDDNPDLTANEKLAALANLRSEFITETNINGKLVSKEVLGKHLYPTLRKVDLAVETKLQGERSKQRELALDEDTQKGWEVALGPLKNNYSALHDAASMNPSKEKRTLFANWFVNSLRTGKLTYEQAEKIAYHPIEKDGKKVPWMEVFGSQEEGVMVFEALKNKRIEENQQLQANATREKAEKEVELREYANSLLNNDKLLDENELTLIQRKSEEFFGIGHVSPFMEELSKLTSSSRAEGQRSALIESMIANGSWTAERANSMKLSFKERERFMGYAINQSKILKSPVRGEHHELIDGLIEGDKNSQWAESVNEKNPSHLYMKDYLKRRYDAEVRTQVNVLGVEHSIASAAAYAKIEGEYRAMQKDPGYVDKNGNFKQYQTAFLKVGNRALKASEARLKALKQSYLDNAPPEAIVSLIGEEKVMEAYEAIGKPGNIASEQWRELANIYGKDPLTMINMLAPVIGKDKIDPNSFELGRLKANMSPLDQATLDRFQTEERRARVLRKAMGETQNAPTRPAFSEDIDPTKLGQTQQWAALGALISWAEGTGEGTHGYQTMFGGGQFLDMSKHPDTVVHGGRLSSAAAGRYQFMPQTWAGAKKALNLKDFGPLSQEMAGAYLTQMRGVDPNKIIETKEEFIDVMDKLSPEWAALPSRSGGSYYPEQRARKIDMLWEKYQGFLRQYGLLE